jgi:translation initiation factor 2 beta subunit (eIF-2beta)/eIF-5
MPPPSPSISFLTHHSLTLQSLREREIENRVVKYMKVKSPGKIERQFILRREKASFLEGSQVSPVRPSDNSVKEKTSRWLKALA